MGHFCKVPQRRDERRQLLVILGHFVNRKLIKVIANNYLYTFFFAAEWWILYGSDAPNLRRIAIRILSQTASSSGCERNWSTFNLIHLKRRNKLGHERLQKLVFVHYNLRLRVKEAEKEQKKKEYTGPIDLTKIFYDEGDEEDPLYEWVKEAGEPVLDERNGRPNSHIASQMEVNVDAFI